MPAKIWRLVLANLDPNDKKTLKTVLHFFVPRVGLPENLAQIAAVNLSNYAAPRSVNIDDRKENINNSYTNWGNLKNFKSKLAQNSQENIREYLKILNRDFLEKISSYNAILVWENTEELKKLKTIFRSKKKFITQAG